MLQNIFRTKVSEVKKIIISSLFFVLPLGAANYIDNPNFDSGKQGWSEVSWQIQNYREHQRSGTVNDQYLLSAGPEFLSVSYHMNGVPEKLPLSFVVEVGLSEAGPVTVKVELVEVYTRERYYRFAGVDYQCGLWESSPHYRSSHIYGEIIEGCRSKPKENLLSAKTVELTGTDIWHVVASDYPAYKKYSDSALLLWVRRGTKVETFQLNYAQVGGDPKALGGRGPRKKNFNANGDL